VLLKGLAATSHGLCVVTTRYAPPDLRAFHGKTVRGNAPAHLARAAGVQLLIAQRHLRRPSTALSSRGPGSQAGLPSSCVR